MATVTAVAPTQTQQQGDNRPLSTLPIALRHSLVFPLTRLAITNNNVIIDLIMGMGFMPHNNTPTNITDTLYALTVDQAASLNQALAALGFDMSLAPKSVAAPPQNPQ